MDPLDRAQVLLLCDLCQRAALQSHCELCQINLCKACVGEHLSDSSKKHNVVPYKHRTATPNYPNCPSHTQKHCELYCDKCDIPVCSTCLSSGKHKGHDLADALQNLSSKTKELSFKTKELEKDLKELVKEMYPIYEEIASDLNSEKVNLEIHYEKLTTAVNKQEEDLHREINIIVKKQKSEIDEMKTKHLDVLNKQQKQIQQIISHIKEDILDLKQILDSSDVSLISSYESRNSEFRSLPPKIKVSLPSFSFRPISTEMLKDIFVHVSALSIATEEHGSIMKTPEAVSCFPINAIDTGSNKLFNVTCLNDEEIWTGGSGNTAQLYNLDGKLMKSINTKSGHYPRCIAVTMSGHLVYTDPDMRTVNILKNEGIEEMIRLRGWKPYYVCSTSSGDLLVTMDRDDNKQSKVVRYSGSTRKQTIQFESQGEPLYSSGYYSKYISENRNRDICVADYGAHAVVVVEDGGKLRFRYTGHPSTTKKLFYPRGITTNSQSQILTPDSYNHCIHILDKDGQFLCYIDNCDLKYPWALCVDTRDNLFVAEWDSGKVKKIMCI